MTLFEEGIEFYQAEKYAEAYKCFENAAENGNADAMYRIALHYDLGRGVGQDNIKAVEWCEKAAELGVGDAMFTIGQYYYDGSGVERDLTKARMWLERAWAMGKSLSRYLLKKIDTEESE